MINVEKLLGKPGIKDVNEAHAVLAVLRWRCQFRVASVKMLAQPAVYTIPGYYCTEVMIYGDYSETERSVICAEVAGGVNKLQTKPVEVFFYPKEGCNEGLIEHHLFCSQNA